MLLSKKIKLKQNVSLQIPYVVLEVFDISHNLGCNFFALQKPQGSLEHFFTFVEFSQIKCTL